MNIRRFLKTDTAVPDSSRRSFLKVSAGASAGLMLGVSFSAPSALAQQASDAALEMNAFVSISPDNTVKVLIKHLEMGQGVYTGLATCVAEELDADWSQVVCEHAPADVTKYANLLMGQQGTGGSTAIANSFMQMRQAGAAAKAMLVAAAAAQWQVDASEITVSNGVVSHGNHSATFGELAVAAAQQPTPDRASLTLKTPGEFKLIGQDNTLRKDVGKHNGTAIYTQDVKLPGMLTAVVAHPPRFGSTVRSFDASAALARRGVQQVFEIDSGVAVVASDYWTAIKARELLQIEWDASDAETRSSGDILAQYRELVETPGAIAEAHGNPDSVLSASSDVTELMFEYPYLAHAQMEPMNCVAQVNGDSAVMWYGCQSPTSDKAAIAQLLGTSGDKVTIHTVFAGGGFGRRANPASDYVLESVQIARQVPNTPVKLVWSREDDMQAGYYRPAYVHKLSAALDAAGKPNAMKIRIAGQSIMAGTSMAAMMVRDGIDNTSVEGLTEFAYEVPERQVELHSPQVGVPVQWWRSVGHTHTAFSKEVFIDALARKAGADPVAYRLELLKNNPRETAVLKLAAEKAGWGTTELPEGWGRGVAVHTSFGSTVAEIVDVSVDGNNFKVERVVAAIDCGIAVNPSIVKAQVESAIAYGLSAALADEVTLTDGHVDQTNFHNYRVLRMNAMPVVETHIVPSTNAPSGVGEPGTPPIAPAVANALAAVTGRTFTRLPLRLA
ncbi:xanthine dehydrogenase family protein molybdopterin-binding subunit [Pseudohongiella sp. SYSU M77423]|uniref:xanthine dehydrogenase family protein molybdopterin-binding subunit n=1 Tax=unclassified Pseudohongiella TaxID=2629611 RepID=UPI001F1E119C|nr:MULTISPECIES: xanthine dehydrogenase family protein molybdopterin-binding subunit [unclassified Pseudohongiella]MDH7943437.1 xanthine dehydrogenase family protein molybdopterin-binding subunit [Pseudohongiella sp. SYSU M77423]MEC8861157.1 xanthine dehydrogenase family protein molybdopterin-binding subunit [Pseudomonadota bacterium]